MEGFIELQEHRHDETPVMEDARRNSRPLWIALAIIGVFFIVELVGSILSGSLALLADAGHMLSDVAAMAMAIFAFWIASRPATPRRTYGYYRAEVLAAMANAITLVLVSLYIFWEAYQRLSNPPEIQSVTMLVVATAGLVANLASAAVLSRGAGDNLNLRGAFLHVVGDTLGSVGAIVAGLVMLFTGWYYADPLVSVLIGLLVLYSGWHLLRESVDVLLEATPKQVDLTEVKQSLGDIPGVAEVHDLHVWTVTSGFLAMSGHLTLRNGSHGEILRSATDLLRNRYGIGHTTIQIESEAGEDGRHGCYSAHGVTICTATPARRARKGHEHHGH